MNSFLESSILMGGQKINFSGGLKTENINFFSKLLDSKSRSNRFRSGTIEIHAEYIPWDWEWVFDWESFNAVELRSWFDNIEQSNPLSALKKEKKKLDTTSDNKKSSFPRGASPKLLDWGQLLSEVFSPPSPSNQKGYLNFNVWSYIFLMLSCYSSSS